MIPSVLNKMCCVFKLIRDKAKILIQQIELENLEIIFFIWFWFNLKKNTETLS